jgi:myo-inositol-1-phosphate synthase
MDRKMAGTIVAPSAYLFKHPPQQFPDDVAKAMMDEFIVGKS